MNRHQLAEAFKAERGYRAGYVIFYGEEIAGWTIKLDRPESWQPGCIAMDESGNEWKATGGNDNNGAKQWEAAQ